MYDNGFIEKGEAMRCITYLIGCREGNRNDLTNGFKEFISNSKIESRMISLSLYGYERQAVWDGYFCKSEKLMKIMEHRGIRDIDRLMFKSWNFYDLDIPFHEDEKDDLTLLNDDDTMDVNESHTSNNYYDGGVHMLTAAQMSSLKKSA